nr:60S ribosomal protein L29-like [Vulpes vulpes]
MCFAKKYKKGLKKMQAKNIKATSAWAEAFQVFVKPNQVKPKIPKGGSHQLNQLTYISYLKLETLAHAYIANSLRLCQPKAKGKAQTKAQASAATQALAPKGAQAPRKLQQRGFC